MTTLFFSINKGDETSFNNLSWPCPNCHYMTPFKIFGEKTTEIPFMVDLSWDQKNELTIYFSLNNCPKCGFPNSNALFRMRGKEYYVLPIKPPSMSSCNEHDITIWRLLRDLMHEKEIKGLI